MDLVKKASNPLPPIPTLYNNNMAYLIHLKHMLITFHGEMCGSNTDMIMVQIECLLSLTMNGQTVASGR